MKLPPNPFDASTAIDSAIEEWYAEHEQVRDYLGGSSIGKRCDRQIYFDWKNTKAKKVEGRMRRLWNRGHREEDYITKLLSMVGIETLTREPEVVLFDGIFKCHCDSILIDRSNKLLGSRPHIGEYKTYNDKRFKRLRKEGLEKTSPEYWVQVHVYMQLFEIDRCLFVAVNKNDDTLATFRIKYQQEVADKYVEKARRLIYDHSDDNLPPRISIDRTFWVCKYCDYKEKCYPK